MHRLMYSSNVKCQVELLGSHVSLGKTIIEETVKFKQKLMGELKSTHHLPPSYLTGNLHLPIETVFDYA